MTLRRSAAKPHDTTDPTAQSLILHLLQEKERLITEKDELVDSKDKLWRGYHQILQEKDEEIERLRKENRGLGAEKEKLQRKTQELAEALRKLVEDEEDDDGSEGEDEDQRRAADVKPHLPFDSQELTDDNLDQADRSWLINKGDEDTKVDNTPANQIDLLFPRRAITELSDNRTVVPSTNSPSMRGNSSGTRPKVTFSYAPLIETGDDDQMVIGRINHIASRVLRSVKATIRELTRRHQSGMRPAFPLKTGGTCAYIFAMDRVSEIRWTVDSPARYACFSCFNARRACLLWMGDLKWLILPLPPKARGGSTPEDAGYYIYPVEGKTSFFPNTWHEAKRKKRKLADVEM